MKEYVVGQTVIISDGANTAECKIFSVEEVNGITYVGIRNEGSADVTVTAPTLLAMERQAANKAALAAMEGRAAEPAPVQETATVTVPTREPKAIVNDADWFATPFSKAWMGASAEGGDSEFPGDPRQAIVAWRKAQTEAITARLRADEIRAQALLAISSGEIEGVKAPNAESRKAYADLQSIGSEGTALRAEARAQALQFWVEILRGWSQGR